MSQTTDSSNVKLEDMNYFWMDNGAPCFIASNWDVVDNICETIESFGFQIYYIICDKSTPKTIKEKDSKGISVDRVIYEYTPAVLKVVNNFTGRVVMDSNDPFGNNFAAVEEVAQYTMPPIPRIIIDKLDEFFRLVDAQHHTESIVILTYDTTKEGPEGWGVLVPEQENTSVHCKYDADSIAELKPDHVMIVGSVHSHPNMAAYASGTDHADQADFDGLHITYGWQNNVNGGATQYHIELQIGGSAYTLKPEDVFETYTLLKEPDPEVVQWSSKVKKAQPLYTGGPVTTPATTHNQSYQAAWASHNSQATLPGTQTGSVTHKHFDKNSFLTQLNSVEKDAIVAFEMFSHETKCLICEFDLTEFDMKNGSCMTCDSPIVTSDMGQYEIITSVHQYCVDRYLDPTVAYYLYCLDEHNPMSSFLLNIKPAGVHPSTYGSDVDSSTELRQEYTLCCDLPVSMIESCTCPETVLEEHIRHFDDAHAGFDTYSPSSKCLDCTHYCAPSCPPFKNAIVDYMTKGTLFNDQITECELFVHYKDDPANDNNYLTESTYYYD